MLYWKFCVVWMQTPSISSYDSPPFQKICRCHALVTTVDRGAHWRDDLQIFGPKRDKCKDHWICVRRMRVGLLDGTRRLDNHVLDLVAGVTFYPMSDRQLIGLD
jgi:hypothetical protein